MNFLNSLSGLTILSALHDLCLDDLDVMCCLDFLILFGLLDCLLGASITDILPALKSLLSLLNGLKNT